MESRALSINSKTSRKPFWLPARSYYLIVVGFAAGSFVLAVGLLGETGNESGVVIGGMIAIGILVGGIVAREIVLRHARERHQIDQRRLDKNLQSPQQVMRAKRGSKKFTLEMNVVALDHIRKKSEAANIFGRIADGHMEVFELCDEYRNIVTAEIPKVHPDSPRLSPMIRGQREAEKLQKFHLLRWAELESRALAKVAQNAEDPSQRVDYTLRARQTIQFALERFPEASELQESADLLDELLAQLEHADLKETNGFPVFHNDDRGAAAD
jgi:hypothetical protein